MAVRQAPTSVVQKVISALVEDPAELRRAAATASTAAVFPGTKAADAVDALPASDAGQVAVQPDADELLKQAEEQAGDQVSCQARYLPGLILSALLSNISRCVCSFKACWTAKV